MVAKDTLFHGKAVLIEASVDFEDVTFKLLAECISLNFLSHSFFEEDSASVIIIDIERFGGSVGRVRNAELNKERGTFIRSHKKINIILIKISQSTSPFPNSITSVITHVTLQGRSRLPTRWAF